MPKQDNQLTKGLHLDFSPVKQPEDTYREALNLVRLSDKGDYYSFTNEKGTVVYCELPNDFSIIGQRVLESDIILILCSNDETASKIGIVDSSGLYTTKLDDINNELNLSLDYPIDIQARVLINSNRVIYFVDNRNTIRTIDLDSTYTIGKIDKLTTLVPTSNFPVIDSFEIRDSITPLTCGAYQFVFRYLDSKNNITNVSIPSALTSIGQSSVSAGNLYQGGYPDIVAEKSIVLNISNVDTDYKKLEIISINYVAPDNIININSVVQLDINNNSTLEYEFKGDVLYPLTVEEVLGITSNYSTAKCIEQKDGRLFISNLKEEVSVEANLQLLANDILLKYSIEKESVNAYKDGNNAAYKVGYKRGEIYSFGFGVIYKNGAKSLVYHIPAPLVAGTPGTIAQNANTTSKELGTYISTLLYPTGQNYPSGNIRYHVMPTYAQEVPYGNIAGSTSTIDDTINILGVELDFTSCPTDIWDSIKDKIQGIFIVRRRRDKPQNTSIFTQGITNYMMDSFNLNNEGQEQETNTESINTNVGLVDFKIYRQSLKVLKKTPFLGGIRLGDYIPYYDNAGVVTWDGFVDGNNAIQTTSQPCQQAFIDGVQGSSPHENQSSRFGVPTASLNNGGVATSYQAEMYRDLLVFYSPETQLLPKIESNVFTNIKRVGTATFSDTEIRFNHSSYENEDTVGDNYSHVEKFPMYYNMFQMTSVDVTNYDTSSQVISKNLYVPRNATITSDYDGLTIDNLRQESFLLLQTETDNLYSNTESTYKYFAVRNNGSDPNDSVTSSNLSKNIYEIVSTNATQYGSVQAQEYVICKYIPYDQIGLPALITLNGTIVYGGDTYITRMSFTNKSPIESKYFHKGATAKWFLPDIAQTNSFGRKFIDVRSNIEFYVESSKNTDLRHSIEGGNGYYRHDTVDSSLITNPELVDDVKSYNNQYDFDNTLQLFYSRSDISSINSHFKTRTIWSDQTILGELRDRYRDIRVNNFYDLPFNTGEIWDSFVFNNIFYLQTPKTLWRTYVNSIEQTASTTGQVVLGTGGVFPINLPPQQVVTQQGGYAGTISQWGGCNTPFGYIFPDSLQGKIFLLSEGLEEISSNGVIRYVNDNISVLNNLYNTYIDNPFKNNSSGLLSAYDFELKRWILVKQHPTDKLTLSFDPVTKQFISNHSYSPNVLLSRDNRLFGIMNSEESLNFYEHNKGDYGNFYNTIYPFSISIVVNTGVGSNSNGNYGIRGNDEKVFDNIEINADSSSTTKIQAYRGVGDTIEVYNDRQHSGVTKLIWNNTYGYLPDRDETRIQFLRNNYNIKIPLNSLISDANAIFDTDGNLINSNIDQNKLYRDRIKGNYCIIKLTFSNEDNYKLTLNTITTTFRQYPR